MVPFHLAITSVNAKLLLVTAVPERNKVVHGSPIRTTEARVSFIESFLCEFVASSSSQEVKKKADLVKNLIWRAPEPVCLKLNVDASIVPGSPSIAIGFVLQDQLGHVLATGARCLFGKFSVEIAELLAIQET
ncbi:hypothetical protein PanWU01x14_076810 [Parasponia andersonii]|uniref:RNase H type-1 domain-containing protein n=1 Tax=Parasponia andersonii TaxID=3476 RepID=A0A2P5DCF6_PARAD|nr:hypothetical protein PanWU01x14_076810 [Parasponia andersonii]